MRYVMKQKLLSWGDDFTIKDEDGRDVFLRTTGRLRSGGTISGVGVNLRGKTGFGSLSNPTDDGARAIYPLS